MRILKKRPKTSKKRRFFDKKTAENFGEKKFPEIPGNSAEIRRNSRRFWSRYRANSVKRPKFFRGFSGISEISRNFPKFTIFPKFRKFFRIFPEIFPRDFRKFFPKKWHFCHFFSRFGNPRENVTFFDNFDYFYKFSAVTLRDFCTFFIKNIFFDFRKKKSEEIKKPEISGFFFLNFCSVNQGVKKTGIFSGKKSGQKFTFLFFLKKKTRNVTALYL